MSYLRYLCLFAHSCDQHILCCVFVLFFFVLYPMLPVYLVCPFLLALLVFSNVYLHAKFNEANIIYIFFTQVFDNRTLYGIPQCPSLPHYHKNA
jgi:hypothetical protein